MIPLFLAAYFVSDPIRIIILLAVIGFLAWLLTAYVPMPPVMKNIIIAVAVLFAVLIVVQWIL